LTGRNNVFSARRLTSTKAEIPEFVTIDGSHRLFAEKADIGRLGAINQNVALAIRPQDISISFGASFPEDNLLRAVVTRVRHLGPTTTIQFDAGGLTLEGVVFRLVGLGVGDECMLGLPPDRIRVLKD
jgi:ABC-type Fe3+/spermidine/putrescine transport system ATPase subunit